MDFSFRNFCEELARWAERTSDVRCILLVGSHARDEARTDSDIDVVILVDEPSALLADTDLVAQFGDVVSIAREDYGRVQSLRVVYTNGMHVEFGITDSDWLSVPLDEGTRNVIGNGVRAIYDPAGRALASRV